MESHSRIEQWKLRELDEVVVPVQEGRFVIKADQQQFKKRVLAPFPEKAQSEIMEQWTFKSLHLEPMREVINDIYKDYPWKIRWQYRLANLIKPPVGLHIRAHVNVDVAQIIRTVDGLSQGYTDEEKEMLAKQVIDATLRHEEEHLRQHIRKEEVHNDSYWKLKAAENISYGVGVTGTVASMLLLGYQGFQQYAEERAVQNMLQHLSQSGVPQEGIQERNTCWIILQ